MNFRENREIQPKNDKLLYIMPPPFLYGKQGKLFIIPINFILHFICFIFFPLPLILPILPSTEVSLLWVKFSSPSWITSALFKLS